MTLGHRKFIVRKIHRRSFFLIPSLLFLTLGTPFGFTAVSQDAMIANWRPCIFGGEGSVQVTDQIIRLGLGDPLTGVSWTGPIFRENFEWTWQARRVEGFDFFCAATFPVGSGHCSLVLGGWSGDVVGISSIDGRDASENASTKRMSFENNRWYEISVRVDLEKIVCRVDDHVVVELLRADHVFDVRDDVHPTLPMGFCNYQCVSDLQNIRLRRLKEVE